MLELDGKDLRCEPIEKRKALLARLLNGQQMSIVLNEVYEEDGSIVFHEACKLGCEGIVSKRRTAPYRSGECRDWRKVKTVAWREANRERN